MASSVGDHRSDEGAVQLFFEERVMSEFQPVSDLELQSVEGGIFGWIVLGVAAAVGVAIATMTLGPALGFGLLFRK
jgi:hypothetical protein